MRVYDTQMHNCLGSRWVKTRLGIARRVVVVGLSHGKRCTAAAVVNLRHVTRSKPMKRQNVWKGRYNLPYWLYRWLIGDFYGWLKRHWTLLVYNSEYIYLVTSNGGWIIVRNGSLWSNWVFEKEDISHLMRKIGTEAFNYASESTKSFATRVLSFIFLL